MSHRRWGVVGAVAVGAVLLGGCGADHAAGAAGAAGSTGSVPSAQSGAVAVTAVDNSFKAETITVTAGSTVTWTNAGRNDHNIKPVDAGDFGVDAAVFKPGATHAATFATPGTYHYFCSIHGTKDRGMIGTVEVVS
ncbi:MAG: cupredoxin domain-containing protein [Acidimicrobiales bacterium]